MTMKILIVVSSKHRQNTLQLAEAMAEAAPATIAEIGDIKYYKPADYDVIGFGSGVYAGKFDGKLIEFAKGLDNDKKCVFVFSTSGTGNYEKYNKQMVRLLESKNKVVLGNFGCKGLCKWFIFAIGGGMAKGHPSEEDFDAAQAFIAEVAQKYEALENT